MYIYVTHISFQSTVSSSSGVTIGNDCKCPNCGYVCDNRGNLEQHFKNCTRRYDEVKQKWVYQCRDCPRAYDKRSQLKDHRKSHKVFFYI